MMNGYLYIKQKNELIKKRNNENKSIKNLKKLKNYNNKIIKNHYHRVKEFLNEMNKNPMKINNFNPLNNKFKQMTNRDKNIKQVNKISFIRSKTIVKTDTVKNNIKEDLRILYNIQGNNNILKNKEINNLYKYHNNINKRLKTDNIKNKDNIKKLNTTKTKINSNKKLKQKKTFFESIITWMYKNKEILYSNKINMEEKTTNKRIYKNSNKLSEKLAKDVLLNCNKFKTKFENLKLIKPFIIKNI